MSIYRTYLLFKAAAVDETYEPDSILRFPFRGTAPKDLDELADRRGNMLLRIGAGGTLGAVGGGAFGYLAGKALDHSKGTKGAVPLGLAGAVIGGSLGSALGGGYHLATKLLDNARDHRRAVNDYYAHGGDTLPFAVAHPYLGTVGAAAGSLVAAPVIGAGIARSLGQSGVHGAIAGAGLSTALSLAANVALARQRNVHFPNLTLKPGETAGDSVGDAQGDMV